MMSGKWCPWAKASTFYLLKVKGIESRDCPGRQSCLQEAAPSHFQAQPPSLLTANESSWLFQRYN